MPGTASRRLIARYVLAGLVFVHLSAYLVYEIYTRQLNHRQLALEARDQWRDGHLDVAASHYRRYVEDYARVTWPAVIVRALPSEGSAWFALGRVDAERRRWDAALADFRESQRLEPDLGRREYRDVLYAAARFAELEAHARQALARDPRSLAAIFDLGAALAAEGRHAAAALAYERGLAYVPDYLARTDPGFRGRVSVPEAELLNLAAVEHLAAGDRERATAACEGLSARLAANAHLDRLCRAFIEADAGRLEASRELLNSYIPTRPEEEALVEQLGATLGP